MALIPCLGCRRHVRLEDAACPFCGAARPDDAAARVIPSSRTRLDRWATFTFASALVAAAACGGTTSDGGATDAGGDGNAVSDGGKGDGGPNDDGGVQALYGLPFDGGADARNDINVAPPYGLPPEDAGIDVNVQPAYGLPPMDAGPDVNVQPLYGLPIPPPDPFEDAG